MHGDEWAHTYTVAAVSNLLFFASFYFRKLSIDNTICELMRCCAVSDEMREDKEVVEQIIHMLLAKTV